MPYPKVKLSDDSGNAVGVTSNRLNVNAYLSATPTIDIGDVSLLLDGTAADYGTGNVNTSGRTLRVTLASDDPAVALLGTIDVDTSAISGNTNLIKINSSSLVSIIGTFGTSTYTEGSTSGYVFGGVRNDTLAALADTDNEIAPLQVNEEGALYTTGNTLQNGTLYGENFTVMGESKVIDGSALPNTVAEGRNARLAVSRAGIAYTCLTDDAGASDLGTTITTHLSEIEGAVETIEGAVSGSEMQVDVVAALPAGTNAIGKLSANSGVDIGDVDITSIAAGDNNIGNVDIASSVTLSVNSHAVTNAGTFAVQSTLQANSGVDIGDVDVTSTVHPAGNGTFNSYGRFTAATSPTALTDSTNGVNDTETAAKEVIIQADYTNTGYLMVGDSGATATSNGIRLNAGDTLILPVADIADIYIDASGASQKVFVTVIK